MSSTDDMDARHGRLLADLAEAGMDFARRLHAAALRPRGDHEFALLAEAFHTVSRSLRQTIALEFKLSHTPRAQVATFAPAAAKPEPTSSAPSARRDRPEQVCWNEHERADWGERLDAPLAAGDPKAVGLAIDASIARIRRGLASAERVLPATSDPTVATGDKRHPDPAPPRPGRRDALLSTASHRGPDLGPPWNWRGSDGEGGVRPQLPWRNSG